MLSTLRQEISSHLLAQSLQGIELLVEELGPTAHAGFRYFAEPFRTMVRCVDGRTFAGNAPAPVERLEPIHDVRYTNRNWLTLFLPSRWQVETAECCSAHQLASP